jgi:hypothetical protein
MSYYPYLLRVYIEALELHLQSSRLCKPILCKAYTKTSRVGLNIRKALNLYKTLNIRKTLPLLDNRNRTHGVSRVREDKANGPILDIEEVTILLSINTKG